MEKSYRTKKIISHAAIANEPYKYDYYVVFDVPDSTPVWIASDMVDSNISVETYWKNPTDVKDILWEESSTHGPKEKI
jgi:hypothetical protein